MRFSLITSNAASSLRQKKQKNYFSFRLALVAGLLLGGVSTAQAAEDVSAPPKAGQKTQNSETQTSEAIPLPPELPDEPKKESDDSRNIPQPEVNIIHRGDMLIEEYRINGRVRYVKITPKIGKPYYLVDKDGDGELETKHSDLDGIPPINEWILLEW